MCVLEENSATNRKKLRNAKGRLKTYSENGLLDHLLVGRVLGRRRLLGGRGLGGSGFRGHFWRFVVVDVIKLMNLLIIEDRSINSR